ncbi:MAG: hypothetical protein QOJ59_2844 [Thermomicrobiales bacterium]|nr:hypothetical protein [Thermomicrobiales bacterium]
MTERKDFYESSGNVFADVGFEDAEETLAKSKSVLTISEIIERKELTEAVTARLLGTTPKELAALSLGDFGHTSLDQLSHFVILVEGGTEIAVTPFDRCGANG